MTTIRTLRSSTEILEMMYKVRQFAALVHLIAGRHYAFRQRPRTAREHADFGNLAVDRKRLYDYMIDDCNGC